MWRPRLMVVDDDNDVASIICRVAENLGFNPQTTSGLKAFHACTEFEPDIIVLDIFMPEVDGFEVLRYLGQTVKKTSVIIASGKDISFRNMAALMCEQEGLRIIANLAKPFTLEQLCDVLADAKHHHPVHVKWTPAWMDYFLNSA